AKLWDISASPRVLRTFAPADADRIDRTRRVAEVWTAAVSRDRRWLATGDERGVVKVWDLAGDARTPRYRLASGMRSVVSVAFNHDATRIVAGGFGTDAVVWSLTNGHQVARLHGHADAVYGVDFSPTGDQIATASWDGTVRLWSASSFQSTAVIVSGSDRLWGIAYSPDGQRIAAAGRDGIARVWARDRPNNVLFRLPSNATVLTTVAFSPDGRWLAAGTVEGVAKMWDVSSRRLDVAAAGLGRVSDAVFSHDGRQLALTGSEAGAVLFDATSAVRRASASIKRGALAAAFTHDDRHLATADADGSVTIWSLDGHAVTVLRGPTDATTSVAFDRLDRHLAAGSWDQRAWLWTLDEKLAAVGEPRRIDVGKRVMALDVAPGGNELAVGTDGNGKDGAVAIWDVAVTPAATQPRIVLTIPGNPFVVRYSNDGQWLVAGLSGGGVALWHAPEYNRLDTELARHSTSVNDIRFNQRGDMLATASLDSTAKVWRLEKGRLSPVITSYGHTDAVAGVWFDETRHVLESVSITGALREQSLRWPDIDAAAEAHSRMPSTAECRQYFASDQCPSFSFPVADHCVVSC
ncbi:MAG TPA: WD40 repeat domain-containing protein, partial [Vicinamibacterales bacterium]|nr:WD40 repeat domain-containing protein [Vicinamibacterales bacterium]